MQNNAQADFEMYAHRTIARVEPGHRVTVDLPSDFPTGDVKIVEGALGRGDV